MNFDLIIYFSNLKILQKERRGKGRGRGRTKKNKEKEEVTPCVQLWGDMCGGGSLLVVSILMFVALLGGKQISPEEEMHFHTPIPSPVKKRIVYKSVEQR